MEKINKLYENVLKENNLYFKFTSPYDIQKFLKSNKNFSKEWSVEDMAAFTKQDVKDVKRLAQNAYAQNLVKYNNGKYSLLKESISETWRVTSNTSKNIRWKNSDDTKFVFVVYDLNVPFGRNDGSYYFMVKDNQDILVIKKGLTKDQAIKYAKDYMNNNKESISTESVTYDGIESPAKGFKKGDYVNWNGKLKGKVREVHKDDMIVFVWEGNPATSQDGIRGPPTNAYPDSKELSKIKKESVSSENVFNYYKFDGKIKYPNKITDKTLNMWFGRKEFESKSREELIKDFLLAIKQKKKGALELLFDYSRDAIDNNLQKYDGIKESLSAVVKLHERVFKEKTFDYYGMKYSTDDIEKELKKYGFITNDKDNSTLSMFNKDKTGMVDYRYNNGDYIFQLERDGEKSKLLRVRSPDKINKKILEVKKYFESLSHPDKLHEAVLKEDYDPNDGLTHFNNIKKSIDRLKQNASELNKGDLWRKFDNLLLDIKKRLTN